MSATRIPGAKAGSRQWRLWQRPIPPPGKATEPVATPSRCFRNSGTSNSFLTSSRSCSQLFFLICNVVNCFYQSITRFLHTQMLRATVLASCVIAATAFAPSLPLGSSRREGIVFHFPRINFSHFRQRLERGGLSPYILFVCLWPKKAHFEARKGIGKLDV